MIHRIILETGEIVENAFTKKEIDTMELDVSKTVANDKATADKAAKRLAVYTKLGLTADEIAALAD